MPSFPFTLLPPWHDAISFKEIRKLSTNKWSHLNCKLNSKCYDCLKGNMLYFYARQQYASRVLVQARITKPSLLAAPRSLVYRDKISCHWVQGFPSNEGVEEGYPLKRRYFAVIGSNSVKTVADRYIHAAYHNKHWWQAFWIHEHRWPRTTLNPSKRGFSEFFAIFGCSAHFNTELRVNGWALVTGFWDLLTSMTLNDLEPLKKRF